MRQNSRIPELTVYRWFCETNGESTTIYANFQGADPNKELGLKSTCENAASARVKSGLVYITVRGFPEMAQAACPWTPLTADQPGLLGVNWSKGWIIGNDVIHDAEVRRHKHCGKEAVHRAQSLLEKAPEAWASISDGSGLPRRSRSGWSKEKIALISSFADRVVYDCGQNRHRRAHGRRFSAKFGR